MKNPDELRKANNQLEEEHRKKCNQLNETTQQKTKCFMCSNLNEHKSIQVTLWELITPDEVKENDYKANYCPNCGRKIIDYVEELCKTYQP